MKGKVPRGATIDPKSVSKHYLFDQFAVGGSYLLFENLRIGYKRDEPYFSMKNLQKHFSNNLLRKIHKKGILISINTKLMPDRTFRRENIYFKQFIPKIYSKLNSLIICGHHLLINPK